MIQNLGTNKWKLDVHPRAGGRRRRKTVTGTKEYAKQVHAQLEKECAGGRPEWRLSSHMLVSELVQLVVEDYRRNQRASLQDAIEMATRWTDECGTTRLGSIGHGSLLTIADKWLETEHLSPARVNRLMAFLLRAFRLRQRDDHALVVPYWAKLKEAPARSGFVEWPHFTRLRAAMQPHGRVPSTLGFWTGMREGEILTLEWRQITLNHPRKRVIIDLRADQTKSEDPRVIVMEGDLYRLMAAHEKDTRRQYPTCTLVCHHQGRSMADTRYFWEPACVAVNLGTWRFPTAQSLTQRGYQGLIFHDLRRTGVRNLIRAGVPEKTAMAISGHKTRSVFERYNIINPRDLEEAGQKVAAYMRMVEREYRDSHGQGLDTFQRRQARKRRKPQGTHA